MLVYTVGTWDLLHVGHLALLQHCKTLGDTVAVGVASDEVVASYKSRPPVIPLEQRMEMLRALRCVDIVRPYHELEYASACKELDVDIFVIGEDWGKQPHNVEVESFLKGAGKSIVQVSYHPKTSSTKIKSNTIAQLSIGLNYKHNAGGIRLY
ncbi:MAG: adenylyltransferase/cytidyltransferase family protein [Candidatus Polarisedimenticolaceae bacterium]|nr:adenylyltransferase/cytidyltransferase family protein [Candidatus Polarisedimenticolaceae bacterium]